VLDQPLDRQVRQHPEEPVALLDLLLGRRREKRGSAPRLLLPPGHIRAQQLLVPRERAPVVASRQFPGQHVGRHYRVAGAVAARPGGARSVPDQRHPVGRPAVQLHLADRVEVEVGRSGHRVEEFRYQPAHPGERVGEDLPRRRRAGGRAEVELRDRLLPRAEHARRPARHAVQQAGMVEAEGVRHRENRHVVAEITDEPGLLAVRQPPYVGVQAVSPHHEAERSGRRVLEPH